MMMIDDKINMIGSKSKANYKTIPKYDWVKIKKRTTKLYLNMIESRSKRYT